MSFLKRLYYFSIGLIIGIIFLFFILNGKKTSCNYGPSARVIDNIISKELIFKEEKDSIQNDELIKIISNGKVRFNKSDIDKKPCALYFIESGALSLLVENCDKKATIDFR
tara:strand:- start:3225 stop:3557 length:333 start_codon:yes stop_codon:yes gene_type:complete